MLVYIWELITSVNIFLRNNPLYLRQINLYLRKYCRMYIGTFAL